MSFGKDVKAVVPLLAREKERRDTHLFGFQDAGGGVIFLFESHLPSSLGDIPFEDDPGLLAGYRNGIDEAMERVRKAYVEPVRSLLTRLVGLGNPSKIAPGDLNGMIAEVFHRAFAARRGYQEMRNLHGALLFTSRRVAIEFIRGGAQFVAMQKTGLDNKDPGVEAGLDKSVRTWQIGGPVETGSDDDEVVWQAAAETWSHCVSEMRDLKSMLVELQRFFEGRS